MPPTRAAFIRYFFPARRLLRPLRSMAVPTAGRTCPAQAGAAAGRKTAWALFLLRPLLRRKGLWTGLVAWGLVLLWLQGLIWAVDYGSLTTGQRARAGAMLRSCGLQPGTAVTEELLRTGEYALLESGEFSWASLNFEKGRLAVEAAPARARPEIAAAPCTGCGQSARERCCVQILPAAPCWWPPGRPWRPGRG